jgi:uncharacterized protein YecE (DUF72 family)
MFVLRDELEVLAWLTEQNLLVSADVCAIADCSTSGFDYSFWNNAFYPAQVKKGYHHQYYAERFGTVEYNGTQYRTPKAETFVNWRRLWEGRGGRLTLKVDKYMTHTKKLILDDNCKQCWRDREHKYRYLSM